jgi:hypothetical protein
VEVAMVEEPQHCFSWIHSNHKNCCGLVPMLLTTCNGSDYGCPLGCKGKKGCRSVKCKMRPRPNVKGKPIVNIYLFTNIDL